MSVLRHPGYRDNPDNNKTVFFLGALRCPRSRYFSQQDGQLDRTEGMREFALLTLSVSWDPRSFVDHISALRSCQIVTRSVRARRGSLSAKPDIWQQRFAAEKIKPAGRAGGCSPTGNVRFAALLPDRRPSASQAHCRSRKLLGFRKTV